MQIDRALPLHLAAVAPNLACRLTARLERCFVPAWMCSPMEAMLLSRQLNVGRPRVTGRIPAALLSEPQVQYIMPRSLGGFRNCQADDSQPEHTRGCVRHPRLAHIETAHTNQVCRGPWAVVFGGRSRTGHDQEGIDAMSSSNRGPHLLGGSLGITRLRSHQARPAAFPAAGVLRVPIGRPFLRQPAIVELAHLRAEDSHFPTRVIEGEAEREGRKERLARKDVV